MKKTTKNSGIKVTSGLKAGGFDGKMGGNHNRNALKVMAHIKAGAVIQSPNHNRRSLAVRTGVKVGAVIQLANHNCRLLTIA